jgi:ribonuclease P/MRP protein subunit RPP40
MDIVYLDLKRAFDKLVRRLLIHKLGWYGIRGKLLRWVQNFLTNRTQRVVISGAPSALLPVTSGVPQGSVLAPLLFLIFINDAPGGLESLCKSFVDDTKLCRAIRSQADVDTLQTDLDAICDWAQRWQLEFNETKCKVIRYGNDGDLLRSIV